MSSIECSTKMNSGMQPSWSLPTNRSVQMNVVHNSIAPLSPCTVLVDPQRLCVRFLDEKTHALHMELGLWDYAHMWHNYFRPYNSAISCQILSVTDIWRAFIFREFWLCSQIIFRFYQKSAFSLTTFTLYFEIMDRTSKHLTHTCIFWYKENNTFQIDNNTCFPFLFL